MVMGEVMVRVSAMVRVMIRVMTKVATVLIPPHQPVDLWSCASSASTVWTATPPGDNAATS